MEEPKQPVIRLKFSEEQCAKQHLVEKDARATTVVVLKMKPQKVNIDTDIDCGWAWVVFGMSFVTRVIMGGMLWAINSYFVVFHEEFKENRSFTAAIGSVTFATFHVTAPIASIFIKRFGVRATTIIGSLLTTANYLMNCYANGVLYLIFTHGIFLGVGFSFISNASLVALSQNFKRFVNLVLGLSLAGTGIGMFIFAQLIPYLLETYGWRGSMYLMAGMSLQYCICGSVMFPVKSLINQNALSKNRSLFQCSQLKKLVASSVFWSLNIAQFFYAISAVTIMVLYKDIAIIFNMDDIYEWSLTLFGAGDIVGRTVTALVTSYPKIHPVIYYAFVNVFCAAIILLHLLVNENRIVFLILGFLLGSAVGSQISLFGIVMLAMFGRELYVLGLGYVQTTSGLGALIGPPIAGSLTDSTKSYTWGLIFIAAVNIISSAVLCISYRLKEKEKKFDEETEKYRHQTEILKKQSKGEKYISLPKEKKCLNINC